MRHIVLAFAGAARRGSGGAWRRACKKGCEHRYAWAPRARCNGSGNFIHSYATVHVELVPPIQCSAPQSAPTVHQLLIVLIASMNDDDRLSEYSFSENSRSFETR